MTALSSSTLQLAAGIAGPYWLNTTVTGEHHVCGRNAAILHRYAADQELLATEHVRRLQKDYAARERRILDAAPDFYQTLSDLRIGLLADSLDGSLSRESRERAHKAVCAVINLVDREQVSA